MAGDSEENSSNSILDTSDQSLTEGKPVELVISAISDGQSDECCLMYDQINLTNRINVRHISSLLTCASDFTQLKRLKISSFMNFDEFSLNFLSKLLLLEELEVDLALADLPPQKRSLFLPSLRSLKFDIEMPGEIEINAPNLKNFRANKAVKLIHPHTVKQIEIESSYEVDLSQFKNVESFCCSNPLTLKSGLLSLMPNLKLLEVVFPYITEGKLPSRAAYNQMKNTMNHLIDQRVVLNKESTLIYYKGIEILGQKRFEDYRFHPNFEN